MKSPARLALLTIATLLVVGCAADRTVDPAANATGEVSATLTADTERVARQIIETSRWDLAEEFVAPDKTQPMNGDGALPCLLDYERVQIAGDIYQYSWSIRIGTDPFDVIGLHRVVRERAPYRPIRARKSVFMLHGDFKTFAGCFLPGLSSQTYPDDFGIAFHLAAGDVDVWGMDQAHNLIPADATDFSSMADWDLLKYADDTRTGMAVARVIRLLTGNGFRKMNLLGYSGGAALGFAVVNEEAEMPRGHRHVSGFIPVDQGMFYDNADFAASDCATSQFYAELVDGGEYVEVNPFPLFGEPARDDSDGPSELIPGFTNLQAALAVAVYPYVEGFPYHFLAGEFDADGVPTGLQYTDVDLWIDFLIDAPPFFANAFSRDEYLSSCGAEFAPWTADLDEVDLPVLYVSAAGGFGLVYGATLDRMTSADISQLTIQLHPAEEIELDFAHIDLFAAADAPALVWQPILDWILSLRGAVAEDYPQLENQAF